MKTAALEATLNGITITDALQANNPIIYCNPAFKKITGYTDTEILGKIVGFYILHQINLIYFSKDPPV